MVKSGIFGQTTKFGQPSCLFHSSIIGIKNKYIKRTVKILMRRLIWSQAVSSGVPLFANVCPNLPDVQVLGVLLFTNIKCASTQENVSLRFQKK